MSLTSHLKDSRSPIYQFFRRVFPNTRRIWQERPAEAIEAEALLPSFPLDYATIGTALDYRIRYYFETTPYEQLVAFEGARGVVMENELRHRFVEGTNASNIPQLVRMGLFGDFFAALDHVLQKTQPEGRRLGDDEECLLARYCVVLALFEQVARSESALDSSPLLQSGITSLETLLQIPQPHWVEDMCQLSWRFYDRFSHLLAQPNIVLNPTFEGSRDVGGADADLIVDGCLIELKTTIAFRPDKFQQTLYQLLGYLLLDYEDSRCIRKVAILYTRQGILLDWAVEELLGIMSVGNKAPNLQELRQEFRQIAEPMRIVREEKMDAWLRTLGAS